MKKQKDTSRTGIEYVKYCRKSEEDKGRQILSIPRQNKWAHREAVARGVKIVQNFEEEKSAKIPYRRPIFDQMVKFIKERAAKEKATGIFTWKLHRLARNPEEAGIIIGMLARSEITHIVTSEREYRPGDNAIISYVDFAFADQYSRDLSSSVTDGLHDKAELGWYPGLAPIGYRNTKYGERGTNKILVDQKRFEGVTKAWKLMASGNYTVAQIIELADKEWHLTSRPTKTRPARPLARSGWYHLFTNPLYYGWYEYPRGSENWHKGKHKPMISAQEFDTVQVLLGRKGRPRPSKHQFAFRGMFQCSSCRTAITAEKKIKRQENGNVHNYIYYHCTKSVNPNCPARSIETKNLEHYIAELLGAVRISDEFRSWAIRYLHLTKEDQERRDEAIQDNKYKDLAKLQRRLESLLLKYTAPENADGQLLSDQEYVTLKSRLQRKEAALEDQINNYDEGMVKADELSEQTFNFAAYAQGHFIDGDDDTKRAILSFAASNLLLNDRVPLITLRKFLKAISDKRRDTEGEISNFRTSKRGGNKEHFAQMRAKCPISCALVDDVRTYYLSTNDTIIIPKLPLKTDEGKRKQRNM